VLDRAPSSRRHPVVVDANAVIEDVLRRTRSSFTAMTFVAMREWAVLAAPTHVDAEVREHLPQVATETGCSVELAVHVWETVHRSLIRFVDVPGASRDERVLAVARRDSDDAPLAHLAMLLAPSVVLTRDRHLTHEGIGQADWLTTIHLLGQLAELDALIWGGGRLAWLSVYLPALAVGGLGHQLMRSELALGLVIGVAVGAGLYLRPQMRAAATNAWTRVGPAVGRVAEATTRGLERRAQTAAALDSRLVTADGPSTPEAVTARLLIEHSQPLFGEQIHDQLQNRGHEISLAATRAMLRKHPSFVVVPGRGFQLGRAFGVSASG
jgi:predicted nucleic acid-binding protein